MTETLDPRPELTQDSHLWTWLLERLQAPDVPAELRGSLVGFRAYGCRLVPSKTAYTFARGDGWGDEAAFVADRKRYLLPHIDQVKALLRELGAAIPPPHPGRLPRDQRREQYARDYPEIHGACLAQAPPTEAELPLGRRARVALELDAAIRAAQEKTPAAP